MIAKLVASGDGNLVASGGGTVTLTNATITNNAVNDSTSASGVLRINGTVNVKNTIIAANINNATFPDVKDNTDTTASFVSQGNNIIGNVGAVTAFTQATDKTGTASAPLDPRLAPLANNGGATQTHALLNGSPAINAGDNCVLTANVCGNNNPAIPTDQRGFARNGTVDIGAFELQANGAFTLRTRFDFDGDNKTDYAVFRPSEGNWFILRSSDSQYIAAQFGLATDIPLNGDFTGDGKADLAVFRPSSGYWYYASADTINPAQNFNSVQFGTSSDTPIPADYDGDRKTDIAVYRGGTWIILQSSNNQILYPPFGVATDKPVPSVYQP